ncbi:MAG: hypothetical protein LV468_02760 [Candidatus Nitrosotenuis sp.]|nr:hypothetical protein [Candidatus Nitrosotenuis sp.]
MKIDAIDLEFLYLAASKMEGFDETDIAKSDLNYLGVGRTLDRLASLNERNLIRANAGKFAITQKGTDLFWGNSVPLSTRMLRLLQVKSLSPEDMARYLLEQDITTQIDELRKGGMMLLTTIRKDSQIDRVREITQEGAEFLERQSSEPAHKIQQLLDEISKKIKASPPDEQKTDTIIRKLRLVSDDL